MFIFRSFMKIYFYFLYPSMFSRNHYVKDKYDMLLEMPSYNVIHFKNTCFFSVCINVLSHIDEVVKHCKRITELQLDRLTNREHVCSQLSRLIIHPNDDSWFTEDVCKDIFKYLGFRFGQPGDPIDALERCLNFLGLSEQIPILFISSEDDFVSFVEEKGYPNFVICVCFSDMIDTSFYLELLGVYHIDYINCGSHYVSYRQKKETGILLDDCNWDKRPTGEVTNILPKGKKIIRLLFNPN